MKWKPCTVSRGDWLIVDRAFHNILPKDLPPNRRTNGKSLLGRELLADVFGALLVRTEAGTDEALSPL